MKLNRDLGNPMPEWLTATNGTVVLNFIILICAATALSWFTKRLNNYYMLPNLVLQFKICAGI